MATFRPGKPYRLLRWTAAPTFPGGLTTLAWDAAEQDGDWSASDLTSSVIERPGLYIVSIRVTKATGGGSVQPLIYVNGVRRSANTGPAAAGLNFGSAVLVDMLELNAVVTGRLAGAAAASTGDVDGSGLAIVRIGPLRWT